MRGGAGSKPGICDGPGAVTLSHRPWPVVGEPEVRWMAEVVCAATGLVMMHRMLPAAPELMDQLIEGVARVNDDLGAVREHFAAQEAAGS